MPWEMASGIFYLNFLSDFLNQFSTYIVRYWNWKIINMLMILSVAICKVFIFLQGKGENLEDAQHNSMSCSQGYSKGEEFIFKWGTSHKWHYFYVKKPLLCSFLNHHFMKFELHKCRNSLMNWFNWYLSIFNAGK